MNLRPHVVIIIARCSHSQQSFGIRFEQKEHGQWMGDWAFAIKETAAKKEGYDRSQITGAFKFDSTYPGCPSCHAKGIYKCGSCSKVVCWDGERHTVTCSWCGVTSQLSGKIESLNAGRDR